MVWPSMNIYLLGRNHVVLVKTSQQHQKPPKSQKIVKKMNIVVDKGLIQQNKKIKKIKRSWEHSGRFVQALGLPTGSSRRFSSHKSRSNGGPKIHFFIRTLCDPGYLFAVSGFKKQVFFGARFRPIFSHQGP